MFSNERAYIFQVKICLYIFPLGVQNVNGGWKLVRERERERDKLQNMSIAEQFYDLSTNFEFFAI